MGSYGINSNKPVTHNSQLETKARGSEAKIYPPLEDPACEGVVKRSPRHRGPICPVGPADRTGVELSFGCYSIGVKSQLILFNRGLPN